MSTYQNESRKKNKVEVAWWVSDAIRDKTSNGFFVHAGLGAGKTYGMCQWLYNRIKLNKRSPRPIYWWIMPTHGKVDDTAIPKWFAFSESIGLKEGKHFHLYETKPKRLILFDGGREITTYYHSADRPNLMVGTEIAGAVGDECGEYKFDVFERTVTRLRDKNAEVLQFLFGGAPQGLTWFADWANFDYYDPVKKFKSYELWTDDNLHNLPPGYIENQIMPMIGHNKNKVLSWRYGKFTSFFEGSAYPNFDEHQDVEPVEPNKHTPVVLCWDNNAPLAWSAIQELWTTTPERGRFNDLYVVEESKGADRLIAEACVDFIAKFDPKNGWRNTPIIIDGDAALYATSPRASGDSYSEIMAILKKYYTNVFLRADRFNPGVDVRVEMVNKAFSYRRVKIDPHCTRTIKSFGSTSWKEKSVKRELKKRTGDDVPGYSDACGYYICKWMKEQDVTPGQIQKILF